MALFKEKNSKPKKNSEVPPIPPKPMPHINNQQQNKNENKPTPFNPESIKRPEPQPNQNPFSNPIKEELPEKKIPTTTVELSPSQQKSEQPFFVRIDKFNETKEQFNQINKKIDELENIIKTLEDIKEKEEKELETWKEDSKQIKEFLTQIDKEIFGRL